jgi:Ca2+-binding RTX toxin-like protein
MNGSQRASLLVVLVILPILAATPSPAGRASCLGRPATIVGTSGNDTIWGTSRTDVIVAKAGNDTVNGLGGPDRICGNSGRDTLRGNDGDDDIDVGRGPEPGSSDAAIGGSGDDQIGRLHNVPGGTDFQAPGAASLNGGSGSDRLIGTNGHDLIEGKDGDDFADAFDGVDSVYGGSGDDVLIADNSDPDIDFADGGSDYDVCLAETEVNCEE